MCIATLGGNVRAVICVLEILSSGCAGPVHALIDGELGEIKREWWLCLVDDSLDYQNCTATFKVHIGDSGASSARRK
jgi:hypothetical protein